MKIAALIEDFQKLPPHREELPTFMEISGYPHYENVCSNILRFFFDSSQPHGLGDLLLKSLWIAAGLEGDELTFDEIRANREVYTYQKNRIDIVVETSRFVIGIENKIFAPLDNDLDDYKKKMIEIANGRDVYGVLLTLERTGDRDFFKNVTYEQFFLALESLLGPYAVDSHLKYLGMLTDFIQTIRRLKRGFEMDKELLAFLNDHYHAAIDFVKMIKEIHQEFHTRLQKVSDAVGRPEIGRFIWRDPDSITDVLAFQIKEDKQLLITMDVVLCTKGWAIQFYGPRHWSEQQLIDGLSAKGIAAKHVDSERVRVEVGGFKSLDEPISDIVDRVKELLAKLVP